MTALIAASAIQTCLGDGTATFAGLLDGACGAGPLRLPEADRIGVGYGYHVPDAEPGRPFRASLLLARCVAWAARQAGLDPSRQRVVALVGTGLGELSAVEEFAAGRAQFPVERLHFADAVGAALAGITDVVTFSNACSAGGHALALAQDLVECGEADAVIVGGADTMTRSMLAMIGRVAPAPTRRVRPFDRARDGVLLGDAGAAVVVVPDGWAGPTLGRLVATGLSCDAFHETAPDVEGISRAMRDAYARGGREPEETDVVVAHGTATALNDPAESEALRKVLLGAGADPLVTAVKGAVGHTSGAAALVNLDVAVRCLAQGLVPPVSGLTDVLPEGEGLRFVRGTPVVAGPDLVQVNAFGFGGVNAVTLVGRA